MLKIGLALGGGSSKGLSHIGVLKALEEENIPIGCISGTSMGAVIGAIYSFSPNVERLEEMTRKFTSSRAFKNLGLSVFKREEESRLQQIVSMIKEKILFAEALFKSYLVKEEDLTESLNQIIPDCMMEETMIPFSTVSLDLISGFDIIKKKGPLIDAVMTSMAVPGLFPYTEENGLLLVDGGPTSSVPVHAAKEMDADMVIAVSLRGKLEKTKKPKTGLEIHLRIDEIVVTRLLEMQTVKADVIIRPDIEDVHWADFGKIDYCIEKGYEAAKEAIPKVRKVIREKSSIRNRMKNFFSKKREHGAEILFQKEKN